MMGDKPLFRWKIEEAEKSLQNVFGVHLKVKDNVHLLGAVSNIKSALITHLSPPDRAVKIIGISGSATDLNRVNNQLSSFRSRVIDILSSRDICSDLIVNFLTSYIREKFYDKDDETPIALEFLITEYEMIQETRDVSEEDDGIRSFRFTMTHIDYTGEFYSIGDDDFVVIGKPAQNLNWKEEIEKVQWRELEQDKAIAKAEEILRSKIIWLNPSIFTSFDDDEPTE